MSTVFFRTLILYIVIVATLKIMGKRQIGELQTSELVVAMLISDLAAVPMQSTAIPLLHGIIPILTLMSCELVVSFITLKSARFRYFFYGVPSVLIRNGIIIQSEMRRLRYTVDDLFEELRLNNVNDLKDVEYAVLETNGQLSVILKPDAQAATPKDLQIKPDSKGPQLLLIKDGVLNRMLLEDMGFDKLWLEQKLREHRVARLKDVFILTANQAGEVVLIRKER